MTTEEDDVEKVRSTRHKRASVPLPFLNSDDENSLSESGHDESSSDEWTSSSNRKKSKRTKFRKPKQGQTLKKIFAERTKNLQMKFEKTKTPETPSPPEPEPDTTDTTTEPDKPEAEETKPVVAFVCDIVEKVASMAEESEIADSERKLFTSTAVQPIEDVLKIKVEKPDKIKEEKLDYHPAESNTFTKSMKPEKDQDADTVIILSDDDDDDDSNNDQKNVPKTVVLNCNIVSSILAANEGSSTSSPSMPKIRVKPIDQMSNSTSPATMLGSSIGSTPPATGTPFSPTVASPATFANSPVARPNFPPAISSPSSRTPRGSPRGARRGSTRGRGPYKPRGSPDVRCLTPRSAPSTPRGASRGRTPSSYSPQSRVTTPSRLDEISLKNISPGGTVIRTGSGSVTITPRKKSPERPPVQRRLFRNEVEGVIMATASGYYLKLANGSSLDLSDHQVVKLREQNNGSLPTKLRIPVPSDVAATIEPRILIED